MTIYFIHDDCNNSTKPTLPFKLVQGVHGEQQVPSGRGGAGWSLQLRLPVFLLATRVAEGRGVLDVMAVSTLPSKMKPK